MVGASALEGIQRHVSVLFLLFWQTIGDEEEEQARISLFLLDEQS